MAGVQLPGHQETAPLRQNAAIRQLAEKLENYALIESPTLTGDPKAPTPETSDNDTSIATTAYVKANLTPYALLDSPVFTGDPTAPTPDPGDNDTSIATTAFVAAAVGAISVPVTSVAGKTGDVLLDVADVSGAAPVDSPALTGAPTAPTQAQGDNSDKIATTAYADNLPKWGLAKATSDQSVSSSTTLADVTELTFPVSAGKTYAFRAVLDVQMGAGGVKFSLNGPAAPTRVRAGGGQATSPAGNADPGLVSAYGSLFYNFTSAQVAWLFEIHGVVQNGVNAGTVALQFAQSSSDLANTTVKLGSYLEYREIV